MQKLPRFKRLLEFIPVCLMILLLTGQLTSCALFEGHGADKFTYSDKDRFIRAVKTFQIIGEGTDFLTVKCDVVRSLSDRFDLHALVLDQNRHPLRAVSGYTFDPKLKDKNHLWFFFFLYEPRKIFHSSITSQYIKFFVVKKERIEMEQVVRSSKTWGAKDSTKIFDLPSPPDQIPGVLNVDPTLSIYP